MSSLLEFIFVICIRDSSLTFSTHLLPEIFFRFHGVYWPAFLIAAGLEPPRSLLCHSHWTVDGEKMSKSKGNIVDPLECIAKYTDSGLRYFLLREGVAHSDGSE